MALGFFCAVCRIPLCVLMAGNPVVTDEATAPQFASHVADSSAALPNAVGGSNTTEGSNAAKGSSTAEVANAAEAGDGPKIRNLLKSGASVNDKQPDGMTALHWATLRDRADLVTLLLDSGADVNAVTEYGVKPLSLACENGNGDIARLLLRKKADPEAALAGGETPLMIAARTGKPDVVRVLLEAGANVNAKERRQQTAVMWAAAEGHTEAVRQLVNAGADYQTPLPSGWTPMFFAVREGRTETALYLLRKELDVDAPMSGEQRQRGPSALLLAVQNGHFETAAALLKHGAEPNAQPSGHGALHAVVNVRRPLRGDGDPPPVGSGNLGSLDFVRQWAAYGGDVNLRLEKGKSGFADFTTTGSTAFVLAAQTGDLPFLKLLLELGADATIPNADGSTAILAAAGVGDLGSGLEAAGTEQEAIEVIRLLLELGLNINVVDDNGETAVHGAAYQNWPGLIRFLVAHGARVDVWNQPNRWGWTPLIIAHGYREGNFRPDAATIECLEEIMRAANVPVPEDPGRDVEANQQSWDRKPPKAGQKPM
jgi:ankyrin repeat protein